MNVRLVCMSCNDKGMLTLRETHSELLANLICFLRSDLTWFEGLPDLVGDHIAFLLPADRLLVLPFGEHEVFIHSKWIALVRSDKLAFFCFIWVLCVIRSIPQALGCNHHLLTQIYPTAGPFPWGMYQAAEAAWLIQKNAEAAGYPRLKTIAKPMVQKILQRSDIKPFKIKYYCEKRDPDFEAKMHEVLVVYQQIEMQFDEDGNLIIPQDEPMIHTVSCDEKPGIQAIATTSDDLCPTAERGCVYRDYEYKRLGTLSLIAGIDLLTGIAITVVSETHKSLDFICLLEKLDAMYPKGDIIRIICDNHSAHKSKEVNAYLATKPEGRFTFVFTPTHGSWLNLIEGFFSKMTKQMLKGIRVASKQELEDRIYLHFDEVNADPVVFHWSYKLDDLPTGAG